MRIQGVAIFTAVLGGVGCSSTHYLHQGFFDYHNGRYELAKTELEQSYNRKPSADAAFLIAECGRQLNKQDSSWYGQAIRQAKLEYSRTDIVSDKVHCMHTIALAYYHLQDYQQARVWFDKLTMGVSTNPDVYFYLGHCAVELNDYEAAMVYLTKYDGLHNAQFHSLMERCKNHN